MSYKSQIPPVKDSLPPPPPPVPPAEKDDSLYYAVWYPKETPSDSKPNYSTEFEVFVRQHLAFIGDILIEKNISYGNAAADPMQVFSKADALERIKVRLDDKLTRIARGNSYGDEDTELDIIGYLVLKRYVELNQ